MGLNSSKEREVEFDLVWYWCHSHADCGIKSNYMPMVNVACFGASTDFHDPFNTFILNSVDHRRQIEDVLYELPFDMQKILYASFADIKFSPQIELIFGKLTGAAHVNCFIDLMTLDTICRKFHFGEATESSKRVLSQVRMVARTNYWNAIDSYLSVKKKLGRLKTVDRRKK